jgi:hypothetical protein
VVKVQKSQVGSVSGGINAVSGLNTLTFGITVVSRSIDIKLINLLILNIIYLNDKVVY